MLTIKKLATIVVGAACFCLQAKAQLDVSKIIPPSPNASALAKFIDQPVNTHTGIPQVSVPIYNWSNANAGLSLGISLSYHAGGVKVEEQASNVGIGWALNAGGAVTRVVRGRPDEEPSGFMVTDTLDNVNTYAYDGDFARWSSTLNPNYLLDGHNNSFYNMLENISKNYADGQQDIFMYSFNGRGGKFYVGKDGSIVLQNKENLQISIIKPVTYVIGAFEIIDEQGVLYHFEAIETTQATSETLVQTSSGTNVSEDANMASTSSWYLSYIKSADRQHTIKFTYQNSSQSYRSGYNESRSMATSFLADPPLPDEEKVTGYSNITVAGKRLSQISFPDSVKVNFTYATALREDMQGDHALEKISVTDGTRVFGYNLIQDYFVGSGGMYIDSYSDSQLRLDKVVGFGGSDLDQPYEFYYNGGLPSKSSISQDYWGYAISGRTMDTRIPSLGAPETIDLFYRLNQFMVDGSNREPDPAAVKSGSLRKIVYPTGGSTVFDMEVNQTFNPYYNSNTDLKKISFTYAEANFDLGIEVGTTATLLTLPFKMQVAETYRAVPEPGVPISYIEDDIDNNPITITISKGEWSEVLYSGTYGHIRAYPFIISSAVTLPSTGIYNIKMTMSTIYPINFNASISVSYPITPTDRPVGGLRVKQVRSYLTADELSTPVLVKNYNYNNPDGKSSGKISQVPNYRYYNISKTYPDTTMAEHGWNGLYFDMYTRSSNSSQPLGAVQGSPIGYDKVTVTEMDGLLAPKGKTVYDFSSLSYYDAREVLPFKPGEYISWGAGLPLKERMYDKDGNLVHSVENTYDVSVDKVISPQHRSLFIGTALYSYSYPSTIALYTAQQGYPIVGNALKKREVERTYNGSNYLEKVTDYDYDTKFQQKTVTNRTSTSTVTSRLFYPYDFLGVSAFASMSATSSNRIGMPVKQEEWLKKGSDSVLRASTATSFAADRDPNGFIRAAATYSLRGVLTTSQVNAHSSSSLLPANGYLEKDLEFESYLTNGALSSYSKPGSAKQSFIWGNNGLDLLASAKNAAPNELYHENFETSGNTATAHTGSKGHTGSFTPSFTAPNAKSYVLTYWSYSSSQWSLNSVAYTGQTLSGIIDDVNISPANAELSTYTKLPIFGTTSQIDSKGLTMFYTYDNFGKLQSIKDQRGDIVKSYEYNYGHVTPVVTYYSAAASGSFTRNNCGSSYVGTSVTYTVGAMTYSSTVSQAAANLLATNDVAANGQAYANSHGTCTATNNLNYYLPSGYAFNIDMVNTATSAFSTYHVSGTGTVSGIPNGTYTVTISEENYGGYFDFYFGGFWDAGSSVIFGLITISGGSISLLVM